MLTAHVGYASDSDQIADMIRMTLRAPRLIPATSLAISWMGDQARSRKSSGRQWPINVRFGAHNGLIADIVSCPLPANHLAGAINPVNLEDRFGDVETDCRDRLHG
jgi:hypothetical protein